MNHKHTLKLIFLSLLAFSGSAKLGWTSREEAQESKLQVVCTLGILGDLAHQVGGDLVEVQVLSSPKQDPHYVEPRPTLMRKARHADVFVQVGLQLELWANKVVAGSGNTAIQAGQPGNVVASTGISTLEMPIQLSREWGDVHPNGNPHVWLDPINCKAMAANIARSYERLDPVHAEKYQANLASFEKRIDEALFGAELVSEFGSRKLIRLARSDKLMEYLALRDAEGLLGGWLRRALPLRGQTVVTYHKTFIYLAERFGFQIPIELEGKPGIPPTPKHKAAVLSLMKNQKVCALMQAVFFDRKASQVLCDESGARLCVVPIDVGPDSPAQDIFGLMDHLLDELLLSLETGGK